MSEYRVEKRREAADVTLVTGATLSGFFFLAGSSPLHSGPERVGDLGTHGFHVLGHGHVELEYRDRRVAGIRAQLAGGAPGELDGADRRSRSHA